VLLMACVVSGVWCVVVDGNPNTVVVEFSFGVWEMTQCVAVCCSVLCCTQNSCVAHKTVVLHSKQSSRVVSNELLRLALCFSAVQYVVSQSRQSSLMSTCLHSLFPCFYTSYLRSMMQGVVLSCNVLCCSQVFPLTLPLTLRIISSFPKRSFRRGLL